MRFFRKQKSIQELASEIATLVAENRRGTTVGQQYQERMVPLNAEVLAGMKSRWFGVTDIEALLTHGERIPEDDRLRFFDALHMTLRNSGELSNDLFAYALKLFAEKAISIALTQAEQMRRQKQWAESLKYCQLAERYFPSLPPQPFYFLQLGYAYWGLQQLKDAYQAFKNGEQAAQNELQTSGYPEADRRFFYQYP